MTVRARSAGTDHRQVGAIPPAALTLVVDASVALPACLSEAGFALLPDAELVAPERMWSEARSTLHELVWRGEVTPTDGEAALAALEHCSVRRVRDRRLGSRHGGSLASSAGPRPASPRTSRWRDYCAVTLSHSTPASDTGPSDLISS